MARGIFIFITMVILATGANAATPQGVATARRTGDATFANQTNTPASSYTYNYMYPYLSNKMRTTLRPADPTSPSTSPINAIVKTEQLSTPRRVVPRKSAQTSNGNTARVATTVGTNTSARRVVARPQTARVATIYDEYRPTDIRDNSANRDNAVVNAATRDNSLSYQRSAATLSTYPEKQVVSSARCLADYTECMNRYCVRQNTKYNRCYCSAKLSQIDATYKPAIDSLIKQIIELKSDNAWTDEEMNEYWESKISKYTGDNSWKNLDSLLDIDWSSTESRVRGQNAFATGHEYCVQHLAGCFYMSANLRDAYRSGINTDCDAYEKYLQKLKNAAESIIGAYQE